MLATIWASESTEDSCDDVLQMVRGPGGVLERGAIFEIGLERGAQENEIVSERGALMPNKEKRLERRAKLWVGALSDN